MADYTEDLCVGGTAFAHESFNTPNNAFDNNTSSDWISNAAETGWLGYIFSEAKQINKITLTCSNLGGYIGSCPSKFQVRAGTSIPTAVGQGTLLLDVDEQGNSFWTTGNQKEEWTFSNSNTYTHYWIDILGDDVDDGSNEFKVAEMEMMGQIGEPVPASTLYDISSVKGNIRGKAAEGFIRPTIKQFFTSADYEEIASFTPLQATGGTISYDGDYKIHTFLTSGTFNVTAANDVEYLIVGGGGGGGEDFGSDGGGGGGAGGVLTGTTTLSTQEYTINVGDGGATRTTGDNTTALGFTALGGGAGGGNNGSLSGGSGGSGGGGAWGNAGGSGTNGQGNDGGAGKSSAPYFGGGGGGAGAEGVSGASGPGDGGAGISSEITGSQVYYGGGGAGGVRSDRGGAAQAVGGSGGGGNGAFNGAAVAGTANTGGGGGGGNMSHLGAAGGSGVVIIRYRYQ